MAQVLRQARQGFERHCRAAAEGKDAVEQGRTPAFLTMWLNAAVRVVREARTKLTEPTALDTPLSTRERELVYEFVSVHLLEMLADADRVLREVTRTRSELTREPVFAGVRRSLDEAARSEVVLARGDGLKAGPVVLAAVGRIISGTKRRDGDHGGDDGGGQ